MIKKGCIMIVDDEQNILISLKACLEAEGYEVEAFPDGYKALERLREKGFDVALIDLRLPKMSGIDILKVIKRDHPETVSVIMTAYGAIETAVEAMKEGAYDYLTKPFSPKQIRVFVKKIFDHHKLIKEVRELRQELETKCRFENIIGKSEEMIKVFSLLKAVAPSDASILIRGESGTGKELIAHAVHKFSERKDKPLVIVSCAALSPNLLESELFGHVKGAFTGAIRDKVGRFELADNGTIFLDEIAEFAPSLQVKLLRVLQEGEFEAVGDTKTKKVNVRVIAATSRNIEDELKRGNFREDLYYRLNVVTIKLPPLRERKDDIPILANFFLQRYAKKNKKDIREISGRTMKLLVNYDWPGNIRELENVIERAVILSHSSIVHPDVLPENILRTEEEEDLLPRAVEKRITLQELEREYIKRLLAKEKSKERIAEILGIDKATLWRKREKYGLR
jgi:DNA-binding NtrC family response regulator